MIPINSPAVYTTSLQILKQTAGHGFWGRAAQIFLACKHYGNQIPQVGSAIGIESGRLQQLLDDLYSKPSRTSPEKIAIIFDDNHQVPSGMKAGALSGPANIWRNNFDLQKGFICYAPVADMLSPAFVSASRKTCPHLLPLGTTTLAGAWCGIKGKPPKYRREDHPKMLRKDPITGEYTVHNPQDISFYSGIIRPASNAKLPIAPLIVAIYHDSFLAAQRTHVDVGDFLTDFGFTAAEASAYFDDDPASAAHHSLALAHPGISWTLLPTSPATQTPNPALPGNSPVAVPKAAAGKTKSILHPANLGTTTSPPPPAVSGWWDAQQAVRKTLEAAGWVVTDTSLSKCGCDFKIVKAGKMKFVEVKSSVSNCTPTLTKTEFDQARFFKNDYVIAIVENFRPSLPATIQWIENPARLQMTVRQVVEYTLPRSIWRKHTSPMP